MVEVFADNLVCFASEIDQGTIDQAKETASMPFIWPHMALMPDAHSGRGSAVGTVIPTKGAVIPAAVGVDIGCFSGDTRIPLLNGTQLTLKEMTEKGGEYWVYSLDKELKIVPGRAVALRTRTDAELMRVVVSGGEEIICTPDHQFMLNDGTYREARDLKFNDSLMPLYRKWQSRDGYESVSTGKGSSRLTHLLVWEHFHGKTPEGHVVHHKDHVHFNNDPSNFELLTKSEHSRYHRSNGHKFDNSSPEFQEKRIAGMRKAMQDPVKRARKRKVAVENIVRYMDEQPEHYRASVAGNGQRGKKYLEAHGYNHKVMLAEHLADRADVYCLQVAEHHNFALVAGVFVHNCGMIAVKTRFTSVDIQCAPGLTALRLMIEDAIPLSPGNYNKDNQRFPFTRAKHELLLQLATRDKIDLSHSPKWMEQLGSLGGGNHFIELCVDAEGCVWLFLHSGSRGVGNKIAQKHIKIAQQKCAGESLPNRDLAYLTEGTPEFDDYIKDLHWAQQFALLNRDEMMDRFVLVFAEWLGVQAQRVEIERINCHHNYTTPVTIEGERLWLTRKGAIDASVGKLGVIPGSMGTRSYVVRGKGSRIGLESAPHGAGRKFSRTQAKKLFTEQDLEKAMAGIEYRHGAEWIDEIPAAYKDIDQIMEDAGELVDVVTTLKQLLNVKGT